MVKINNGLVEHVFQKQTFAGKKLILSLGGSLLNNRTIKIVAVEVLFFTCLFETYIYLKKGINRINFCGWKVLYVSRDVVHLITIHIRGS